MLISKKATDSLSVGCHLGSAISQVSHQLYHPEHNPNGAINLGLAHNDLLQDEVVKKAQSCLEIQPFDVNYGSPQGSKQLRQIFQAFFTRHFKPFYPLDWSDIYMQTGAGASVNQLVSAVSDPGDYCMIPVPYYGAFDLDVTVHTGVKIIKTHPHSLTSPYVDMAKLEETYQQAQSEGRAITSMIITSPDNPLGRCYRQQDLETFLTFASRHHIHVISDEIYALSTFAQTIDTSKPNPFVSILSLDYKKFIDAALVHVIYGLSKDFAINGFRIGFIINQFNDQLKRVLGRTSIFSFTSTITDRLLCNLFRDDKWIDDYLARNREALAISYVRTTEFLNEHQIGYIEAEAGMFFLVDTRSIIRKKYHREATIEDEKKIWRNLIDAGVYLAPGYAFHVEPPGFFRLTFSLEWEPLSRGLNAIVQVLNDY
ncbi:pyridoxal phosphate-dependent transferase [Choanephora cucurbitarum]|nr:pyridoxal phosphate-dependent transferase [Choanephora cucurbitarum]